MGDKITSGISRRGALLTAGAIGAAAVTCSRLFTPALAAATPKVRLAWTEVPAWQVFPFNLVGEAVHRGDADALAHLDPWAWSFKLGLELQAGPGASSWAWGFKKEFGRVEIANTHAGVYKDRVCCVLGANGPFPKSNLDAVRRVATANLAIHEYTADHPDKVAAWYAKNLPQSLDLEELTADLGSLVYHNHPIGHALIDQIRLASEDLKLVRVLDPDTDPAEFAKRVTVNVLT